MCTQLAAQRVQHMPGTTRTTTRLSLTNYTDACGIHSCPQSTLASATTRLKTHIGRQIPTPHKRKAFPFWPIDESYSSCKYTHKCAMNRDDRIIGVANLAQYRNIVMYTPVSTSEGGPPKSMYHHIDRSAEVFFFPDFVYLSALEFMRRLPPGPTWTLTKLMCKYTVANPWIHTDGCKGDACARGRGAAWASPASRPWEFAT